MEGLLRATFGLNIPRFCNDIIHVVFDEPLNEKVQPFDIHDVKMRFQQSYESPHPSFDDEEKMKYQMLLEAAMGNFMMAALHFQNYRSLCSYFI